MKLSLPLSVLVLLGLFAPNLYADPVLTINAGTAVGALVETPIVGGDLWVFTDTSAVVLGADGNTLGSFFDNDVITATFTDIAGVALLNVTDVCANASVLVPVNPCAGFAFSDTALGTPFLINGTGDLANLDLAAGVDVNVGVLGLNLVGASIGSGAAQIGFNNPAPSVTPEPSALTLFGTGLLGLAGVMKKKFCV
jgi:hypothetical protein